jgi:hypothetical protein
MNERDDLDHGVIGIGDLRPDVGRVVAEREKATFPVGDRPTISDPAEWHAS